MIVHTQIPGGRASPAEEVRYCRYYGIDVAAATRDSSCKHDPDRCTSVASERTCAHAVIWCTTSKHAGRDNGGAPRGMRAEIAGTVRGASHLRTNLTGDLARR